MGGVEATLQTSQGGGRGEVKKKIEMVSKQLGGKEKGIRSCKGGGT